MTVINKYGLLVAGIIFVVGAFIAGVATLPALAEGVRGNGNSTGNGTSMMGGSAGGMMGNGSGGMMNGGMMGDCSGMGADLNELANATDFDKAFIEAMVPHHAMALMMTSMEQSLGQKSDLRTLAQNMYSAQSAEIDQMRAWYQQWYGTSVPTNQR